MRMTRMVEISIQAVSPLLIVGAASCASAGSKASNARPAPPRRAAKCRRFIGLKLRRGKSGTMGAYLRKAGSEGIDIRLARADADRLFERQHEDLAVADLPRAGSRDDRVDHARDELRCHRDFDLQFRQETDGVFGAAIDFRVPLLSSVALHFGQGQPV